MTPYPFIALCSNGNFNVDDLAHIFQCFSPMPKSLDSYQEITEFEMQRE
jgi:hypothetical protein